jgi:hypothetical protein
MASQLTKPRLTLENLDENADIFAAIKLHLDRLGWRPEIEADRQRDQEKGHAQALLVLQDIKVLEQRAEKTPGDWVEVLRNRQSGSRKPSMLVRLDALAKMSADAREISMGGLEGRLFKLADTGRVTKDEYDALVARLVPPR